ncbi:twin-arginine translocase TatA/TatE family subunit [Nocardioides oleivorans]|uniref:Sec-independent protein translocase protein TatA n=2 Tax=Nocardioides oleivorans TaxID=273676 RepID=A0A4Q2RQQ5_9ACTN|nr:twin-arginine translocase TatA/TatE family subunit [Nocardioides oleivorans]
MELFIILAVLVLLFGASKLPELARGSGQALKIFKAETKGLIDSDDEKDKRTASAPTTVRTTDVPAADQATSQPVSQPIVVETPREHDAPRA